MKETAAQIKEVQTKGKEQEEAKNRDAGKPTEKEKIVAKEVKKAAAADKNAGPRESAAAQVEARKAVDDTGQTAQKHLGDHEIFWHTLDTSYIMQPI